MFIQLDTSKEYAVSFKPVQSHLPSSQWSQWKLWEMNFCFGVLQQIRVISYFFCSPHSAFMAPCFLQGEAAEQVFLVSKVEEKILDLRLNLLTTSIASLGTTRAEGAHCSCPTDLGSDAAVISAKPVGPPQGCRWTGSCTAPWTAMVWSPWWMDPQPSCSPMDSFCQRW